MQQGAAINLAVAEILPEATVFYPLATASIARWLLPQVRTHFAVPDIPEISQVRFRAVISAPALMRVLSCN